MIPIEVFYATRDRQVLLALEVEEGTSLAEAIVQSGIQAIFPTLIVDPARVGIFGERVDATKVLQAGDRIEIYRPLEIDPKEARRRRASKRSEAQG